MNVRACVALFIVIAAAAEGPAPPAVADEKAPGESVTCKLDQRLLLLDPVPLAHQKTAQKKADWQKIKVGDKALIRVSYDPAVEPVDTVTVRFSARRMAVCEVARVPPAPPKEGERLTSCVSVLVKATDPKPCTVAVDYVLSDGSSRTMYFTFDIEAP
jgi:hypothetical protein